MQKYECFHSDEKNGYQDITSTGKQTSQALKTSKTLIATSFLIVPYQKKIFKTKSFFH